MRLDHNFNALGQVWGGTLVHAGGRRPHKAVILGADSRLHQSALRCGGFISGKRSTS